MSDPGTLLDFRSQVAAYADLTNRTINETHRLVAIKLFSAVVLSTPVDTGLAIGNWQTMHGEVPSGILARRGAQGSLEEIKANVRALTDAPVFMANSVPYILHLEYGTASYGFSPKAPAGMVRVNVARFQKLLSEALEEAKAKVKK